MKNQKNQETLDVLIEKENTKLKKLLSQRSEFDAKIEKCESTIQKYTLMKNSQQLKLLSNALNEKGISIEDIMSAVSSGDMLTLQEKIEKNESTHGEDEED